MSPTLRHHRAAGITLVEVIAGLAIIGTLVAMAIGAQSRLVHQWKEAELRVEASTIADEMLTEWWQSTGKIPLEGSGQVRTHGGWTWRTQVMENEPLVQQRLQIVRLSLFAPPTAGLGLGAVAEVDTVLRVEEEPTKP